MPNISLRLVSGRSKGIYLDTWKQLRSAKYKYCLHGWLCRVTYKIYHVVHFLFKPIITNLIFLPFTQHIRDTSTCNLLAVAAPGVGMGVSPQSEDLTPTCPQSNLSPSQKEKKMIQLVPQSERKKKWSKFIHFRQFCGILPSNRILSLDTPPPPKKKKIRCRHCMLGKCRSTGSFLPTDTKF